MYEQYKTAGQTLNLDAVLLVQVNSNGATRQWPGTNATARTSSAYLPRISHCNTYFTNRRHYIRWIQREFMYEDSSYAR